jgi:rhamnose utilization protein RhaD (predicted bifunctional aldolase and dehydrogenase)
VQGILIAMIKTGPELKQVRQAMGWSPLELARALRLAGDASQGEKRVREMESGVREISGPVSVAVEAFLHGFTPRGFQRTQGDQPQAS